MSGESESLSEKGPLKLRPHVSVREHYTFGKTIGVGGHAVVKTAVPSKFLIQLCA